MSWTKSGMVRACFILLRQQEMVCETVWDGQEVGYV